MSEWKVLSGNKNYTFCLSRVYWGKTILEKNWFSKHLEGKSKLTRNVVPFGAVCDTLLKMFIWIHVTAGISIVHQWILLHTEPTHVTQELNNDF